MPGKTGRVFAGIGWVVGSLTAWAVVCNAFTFAFTNLQNQRHVTFPEWTDEAYNWTAVGGIVLIPAVVAVLAIRAYLPGTGTRPSKYRGFCVEAPRPSDSAPAAAGPSTANATSRPQVLEYRRPTTPGPERSPLMHALCPLGLMLICAIATKFVPIRAGGSEPALVTSLILVCSGCWYAVARVLGDRRYRILWRVLISVAAVSSVATVAYVAAWDQLRFGRMWWVAYGKIQPHFYPPICCVAGLIVVSIAAWIDRRMRERAQEAPRRPAA